MGTIAASSQQYYLFIGTYTSTGSKGIYVYRFDAATGQVDSVSHTEGIVNPSYLAIAPGGKYVYAATETRTPNAGSISAFVFDRATGRLRLINKQPSGGDNPVYVSVHHSGKWVVMANYSGGSLSVFPLNADGDLRPFSQNIIYQGRSVNPERQDRSHVHSVIFSPQQDYLMVQDLGQDKVMVYHFDEHADPHPRAGQPLEPAAPLRPAAIPFISTLPGTGPRHLAFPPDGRYAYLVEEMGGAVDVYRYDAGKGSLDSVQRILAHPDTSKGPFRGADIHVSPDGRFLYVTNRESESNIAIFSIDSANGKLTLKGYEPTQGIEPRNFLIDPSGAFLLVANQESNSIVVFRIDPKTGLLHPTGEKIMVPLPTCLKMME